MNITEMHQRREAVLAEAKTLADGANYDGNKVDALVQEASSLLSKIHSKEAIYEAEDIDNTLPNQFAGLMSPLGTKPSTPSVDSLVPRKDQWVNATTGEAIKTYGRGESIAKDLGAEQYSLGRYIKALAIGDSRHAQIESAAMSTSVNSQGGVMINDELSANVIDFARANSVLGQAGMVTVPYSGSDLLRMVRINSQPTVTVKAENAAFPEVALDLDSIQFVAHTLGIMVVISKEALNDSMNAGQLIEETISKALAAEIDRLGLAGSGSSEPSGILTASGINTTAVGGALAYGDLLTGINAIEGSNHVPGTIVQHPDNEHVLRQILVNSEANAWASPPPAVGALQNLMTTSCPASNSFIMDGTKLVMGLRQGIEIQVSDLADTAFSKHQTRIKATVRLSFGLTHPLAFWLATGIA